MSDTNPPTDAAAVAKIVIHYQRRFADALQDFLTQLELAGSPSDDAIVMATTVAIATGIGAKIGLRGLEPNEDQVRDLVDRVHEIVDNLQPPA